jgi:uncharacterized lipoprotein YajG
MTKTILAALLASFLVAGCASAPATASNERVEPVYRTGSNIAVKNRDGPADSSVTTVSREDLERARAASFPGGTIPKSN